MFQKQNTLYYCLLHAIKRNDSGSGRGREEGARDKNHLLLRRNWLPFCRLVLMLPSSNSSQKRGKYLEHFQSLSFWRIYALWYVRRPSQIGGGGKTISCFTVNRKGSPAPRPLFHVTQQGWFLLGMEYWRPDSEAPANRHRQTRIHMRANTCIQKRQPLGLGLGFTMIQMQKSVLICFPL